MTKSVFFGLLIIILGIIPVKSQPTNREWAGKLNVLTPATPFVNISPNPAVQSLGSIRSIDINKNSNGHFLNPAIAAHTNRKLSLMAAYTPWMRELIPDASLSGVSLIGRLDEKQVVNFDYTHFQFKIARTSPSGIPDDLNAKEIIGSLGYSRLIGDRSSAGIRIKYINSNLTDNKPVGGVGSHPGRSLAADLGYSINLPMKGDMIIHQFGASINNLGTKISYSKDSDKDFIPTSLTIGYSLEYQPNENHTFSIGYEIEKLLVPTPPIYYPDSLDISNDPVIQYGYDPNVTVIKGMLQSFYDAPGGYQEELHELVHHFGFSYSNRRFSFSSGLVLEHPTKGNQKYASFGFRFQLWKIHINTFYLLPFYHNSSLKNTLGISLGIDV